MSEVTPTWDVEMFTDGAAVPTNPGPGGYAVIWSADNDWHTLSGAFRWTTNNRMELFAAITGLEALDRPSRVRIVSDAKYLVNAISKDWIRSWRHRGWKTRKGEPMKNADLWLRLDQQLTRHAVEFAWVRGHNGHLENGFADRLANDAARKLPREIDQDYEVAVELHEI